MGLGSFLGSAGGGLGAAAGFAAGGPIGGMIGASLGSAYSNKLAYDRSLKHQQSMFGMQSNLQREFAQKGIQWKVADAKRAGIHPLAALGAQTYNASPAYVDGLAEQGQNMGNMGQDISRALVAQASTHDKQLMDINLSNAKIDNKMKQLELQNKINSLQNGGQTGAGRPNQVESKAFETTSHARGHANIEAGHVASTGYARTGSGLMPTPSTDVKEKTEDMFFPETIWSAKNYLGPAFGSTKNKPPKKWLPKGFKDWEWSVSEFEWKPVRHKGRSPIQRYKQKIKKWWNKK
jgi:hypothetical protein